MSSFENISYELHNNTYGYLDIEKDAQFYENWFDNGSVDVWRHLGMLSVLDPFIEVFPEGKWLTVGDGRYGTSAIYINRKGGHVLASDISTDLLKVAKQKNWIKDFAYANAEALPFSDNEFDFSYCKQSFHHFPRPAIAVYEMLRVSSSAIIFSEPADWVPNSFLLGLLKKIKNGLKRMIGKRVPHQDEGNYEEIGNYVYTINEREFEKIALGLNLPCVAFKRYIDIYFPGVEFEKVADKGPLLRKMKRQIAITRFKKALSLQRYNNIQAIIFKTMPPDSLIEKLRAQGYKIVRLPKNPHV